MVDSKNLISLPPWVRVLLVGVLLALFLGSAWLVLTNVGNTGFRDWFLVCMSVLQMASTGLLLALVLFFAEADVSVATLRDKTKRWLLVYLPQYLGKITGEGEAKTRISAVRGVRDIFGAQYEISMDGEAGAGNAVLRCWVGLNVNRLIVIYWTDAPPSTALKEACGPTFSGARNVGWGEVVYQLAHVDGKAVTSIWTTWMIEGDGFLKSPEKQLFVAQDIAMMTQSILRSAIRSNVSLVVGDHWPRPL
ncbi:MAG: hypothetical protein ACK5TT_07060 [Lysobacteraceae bacterium]